MNVVNILKINTDDKTRLHSPITGVGEGAFKGSRSKEVKSQKNNRRKFPEM